MSEHRREEFAVIVALGNVTPFVVSRAPCALMVPVVKIGEDLCAYLTRSELPDNGV
jgi:hypothetical protein